MRHSKWILSGMLLACIATLGMQGAFAQDDQAARDKWEKAIAQFEAWDAKNAVPDNPVLFIGSSSIRMWPTSKYFPDLPVINRGFGGSQVSDVNLFIDRIVVPYKPRVIAFYAGDNDIAAGESAEQVFKDYQEFVRVVRGKLPATRIIFLPIKPSVARWSLWPKMREANEMIREFSEKHDYLYYADTPAPMIETGSPPAKSLFLEDGLHLSDAGYEMWTRTLRPVLSEALGESAPKNLHSGQQPQSVTRVIQQTVNINYMLYLPPGYGDVPNKKWPLMIFLHGAGERGDELNKVTSHGPARYAKEGKEFPFIIVSPQCPEREWWNTDVVLSLLDSVMETRPVDPQRVYLTGLSMGGFGTWAIAARAPERFAAIAPICGGGEVADAPKLKSIPIWAFHGGKDPVVPLKRSEEMVDAVNKAGGNAKLTVYPEAGHDSWTETYENPEFYTWLLSHKR